MDNKCGCVILNYNDYETTIKLINHISSYSVIKEIIIVDNCSTDHSFEELKKKENEKIRVVKTDRNGGYGYGNNYGIKAAIERFNEKYILLCNPDVFIEESTIKHLLDVFKKNDSTAIVSAMQKDIHGRLIQDLAWPIPTAFEYAIMGTRLSHKICKRYDASVFEQSYPEVDCVPGACLMIDAERFLDVGGFDEAMFLYCEETAIGVKMRKACFKTVLATSEYYIHEHSVSISKSIQSLKKQKELIFKSRLYVMEKYLDASKLELLIARMIQKRLLSKT